MKNALRARLGGAAGVISCAEMCWQARVKIGTLGRCKREWWRRFGQCRYAARLDLWERLDSLVSLVGIFYVKTWCYRCLRWCEGGFTSGTLLSDVTRCDG